MKLPRLFRGFTFQLTLLYMVLFGASMVVLLVFIYFTTLKEVRSQIENTVAVQMSELSSTYHKRGLKRTISDINELMAEDTEHMSLYLLIDKHNQVVAGNMNGWPEMTEESKWSTFKLEDDNVDEAVQVLARTSPLGSSYKLLVGYRLEHLTKLRSIMINVLLVSMALSLITAALCSSLIMHIINRRLGAVNQACKRVIHGNISERVPVSGSDDAFGRLATNFNAMLSWINDLVEGIRDVSNSIAHDLRSPLSRLRNRLENIIIHHSDPAQTTDQLKAAIHEVDSLMATFNALLKISQAEAGAGVEQFSLFNLSEVTGDVIDFYTPLAEEKEIILSTEINLHIWLYGEKHLVSQAFANIIDNAVKYTPRKGKVVIRLFADEYHATFSVADNGIGIPPTYYERVKERFFRLDHSRTTPGNGLGLSLVNAVIKLHQSEIVFSENAPHGLVVTITMPLPVPGTVIAPV